VLPHCLLCRDNESWNWFASSLVRLIAPGRRAWYFIYALIAGTVIIIACRPCMIYERPAKRSLLNGYILLLIATAPPYKLTTLPINGEKSARARRAHARSSVAARRAVEGAVAPRRLYAPPTIPGDSNWGNHVSPRRERALADRVSADVLDIPANSH